MADIRALLRNELASRRTTDSSGAGSAGTRVAKKRKLNLGGDAVRKKTKPTTYLRPDNTGHVPSTTVPDTNRVNEQTLTPEPQEESPIVDSVIQPASEQSIH